MKSRGFSYSRTSVMVGCASICSVVMAIAACGSDNPAAPVEASTDASPDSTADVGAPHDGSTVDSASPDTGNSNANEAEVAWLGFEDGFVKALDLAFDGFNDASGGTIATKTASGANGGTLTVAGDVDQGGSSTKTMNLEAHLAGYSDNGTLTYDPDAAPAALDMTLTDIPTGTVSGTFVGTYKASGTFVGSVAFDLTFTGPIQSNAVDSSNVERKPGATHVAGTVTMGNAKYTVDVVR